MNKPPHIELTKKVLYVIEYIRNHVPSDKNLSVELQKLSKKINCGISLYDKKGKVIITTEKYKKDLDENLIKEIISNQDYIIDEIDNGPGIGPFMLFPESNKNSYYSYIGIFPRHRPISQTRFVLILLFCSILLSGLVYPLVRSLTKPLEEITEKALNFSMGDFTGMEKNINPKGNDEIATLTRAFYHMANELSAIIEGKKELISDISHELGSPLSRMRLAVQLIEDKVQENQIPSIKNVEKLTKNIEEMSKLVKELLDFSRMDKGYNLKIEAVNLEELIATVIQKFQILIEKNNITVKIQNKNNISQVFIDRSRISRVLENLIANSIDYSPANGKIDIILIKEDRHFSVSIKDEGPGISEENKEKIFEPFFREDTSRARETGGTGLGLAIVKKIITLHRGKILVENPGQKGALITFTI
jgi:two-component system sensor histidine kinase CpxA